jgi:hypothetical protein
MPRQLRVEYPGVFDHGQPDDFRLWQGAPGKPAGRIDAWADFIFFKII